MELKRRKLEKPDDDEKWSKKPIKLDASKLRFLDAFKDVYNACKTTQTRCAREIRVEKFQVAGARYTNL